MNEYTKIDRRKRPPDVEHFSIHIIRKTLNTARYAFIKSILQIKIPDNCSVYIEDAPALRIFHPDAKHQIRYEIFTRFSIDYKKTSKWELAREWRKREGWDK